MMAEGFALTLRREAFRPQAPDASATARVGAEWPDAVARHRSDYKKPAPYHVHLRSDYRPISDALWRPTDEFGNPRAFTDQTSRKLLQGDDYPLEYYEDGYPKLPACLDRRPRPTFAEAA